MFSSSSSASSYPPVVPAHCSNVPLYELVRCEEEHCRVWLRDEMKQIPDPLIDSLFHGLIMSSSSSAVPQSRSTVSELCALLEGQKVEVSRVLMGEMNRVVNTLFERLNNKLRTNSELDRSEVGGDRAQVGNLLDKVESPNPQSHQVKREIEGENEMELKNVMDKATQTNEQIEDCVKQEIKVEFEDGEMVEIKKEEDEEDGETQINVIEDLADDNEAGADESQSAESAPMDTIQVNRQSGRVEKRKQTDEEPQVHNDVNNRSNQEEAEGDDGDEEEVTFGSVKRARPSTKPCTTSSSTKDKQMITVTLRCPHLGCGEIAKDDFKIHMWSRHSIGSFQCAVKDCTQSFSHNHILSQHIAESHQSTSQFHCSKCPKYFATYKHLSQHNTENHQLGHFQCSFPSCTFTGENRKKVFNHYRQQHKDNPDFVCPQSGCLYRTKNATRFKAHELSHLGTRPYHCKWPECHYSNSSRNATMIHIKRSHFKSRSKKRPDLTHLGQPKDYLEVVR